MRDDDGDRPGAGGGGEAFVLTVRYRLGRGRVVEQVEGRDESNKDRGQRAAVTLRLCLNEESWLGRVWYHPRWARRVRAELVRLGVDPRRGVTVCLDTISSRAGVDNGYEPVLAWPARAA